MSSQPPPPPSPPPRPPRLRDVATAVLWSFFGVRKRRGMQQDMSIRPHQVILVGLGMAALLVLVLILVVRLVVRAAGA